MIAMFHYFKKSVRPLVPTWLLSWRRHFQDPREQRGSNTEIFSRIYRQKMWGGDGLDFYSGEGSASELLAPYISGVRSFLSKLPASVVVDIGCGDFVAGSQLADLARSYVACDVVPELIERNRRIFVRHNITFMVIDAAKDALPPGDIVIVKQVFQHLRNDQIHAIARKLSQYRTWIICEHTPIADFSPNVDMRSGHGVRIRFNSGVVLTEPPFSIKPRNTEILSEAESYYGVIRTLAYTF
jgi:hypothetical protein